MNQFIKEHSLSIALFFLFFVFLIGLGVTGFIHQNSELSAHHKAAITFTSYLVSSAFFEAIFENWESEFLQMGALVVLTIWLVQKGSADSKKLRGKNDVDTSSRYSIIHASTWHNGTKAAKEMVYANSLSLVLFGLFILSFILHAVSGAAAANQEATLHGQEQLSVWGYMWSSQFWFESFQNWQSEFLSVGALIVFSVYFRQRKSPESKPIGQPNSKTGN
jgi:hypothetical protein